MFKNPFKRAVEAIAPTNHVAVAEQIHKEFNEASIKLYEEANQVLIEAQSKDIEVGCVLNSIGFSNTKNAIESKRVKETIDKNTEISEVIKNYSIKFPLYKFITTDKVIEICDKYKLTLGLSDTYVGEIPRKNTMELANFHNWLKENHSKYYYDFRYSPLTFIKDIKGYYSDDLIKIQKAINKAVEQKLLFDCNGMLFIKSNFSVYDALIAGGYNGRSDYRTLETVNKYFIAGEAKDFNTEGRKTVISAQDPVILYPINHGFLIVTAWGPEASDPNIVNQKMN